MIESISISEGRPSAIRTLLGRAFRPLPNRQNFVRPPEQTLDPTFHCPACETLITVPSSQAGKKCRCRHCYSAIRNADPRANKAAVDLSYDSESITHPDNFPLIGHRAAVLDYLPRGAVAALPLLFLVGLALTLVALLPKGNIKDGVAAGVKGPTPIEIIASPAIGAEDVVTSFLSTSDWTHSVAHVHGGIDVAAQIANLTDRIPEGNFSTSSSVNDDGTSTVQVNFADGSHTKFRVANIDGEDLILWEAYDTRYHNERSLRMVGMPMEPE